ncbi:hypothetical protein Pcinc_018651 [Petrolisthes cinctipes]|uniref:Uncharacterized protein n=1 Tax=Petrolisthes cinctipes TaxID=88211 RepID=A0AAE1KIT5_PETCI|nr:hypothetical protein Pcinc_018651 [Petrolisthes cinctipes]
MVAAAAVASAIQALLHKHQKEEEEAAAMALPMTLPVGGHLTTSAQQQFMQDLFHRLHAITQIDTDCLKECHLQIENWTQSSSESLSRISESTTPIDVQKVLI